MGLNVKNDEARRLAAELAELTGESMTKAVTVALRERLERIKKLAGVSARIAEANRSVERSGSSMGVTSSEPDEMYDDRGLWK